MTTKQPADQVITDTSSATLDVSECDTVTIYPAKAKGQWRWRRTAHGNHKKIANSGEAYTSKTECLEALTRVNRAPYRLTYGDN